MQNIDDLEKKLLARHYAEYVAFTRLLLSLTIASLAFLAALLPVTQSVNWASFLSVIFLLISGASGVAVQHQIMMAPIQHLKHAHSVNDAAVSAGDVRPITIGTPPSKLGRALYKLQVTAFALAFLFLSVYALVAL